MQTGFGPVSTTSLSIYTVITSGLSSGKWAIVILPSAWSVQRRGGAHYRMTQSSSSRPGSTGFAHMPRARNAVRALPVSKVREIANAGFGRSDILRFWFGESSRPTPDYIRRAAIRALDEGRTFYSHNNGIAELRAALSRYLTRLHGMPVDGSAFGSRVLVFRHSTSRCRRSSIPGTRSSW